MGLYTSTGSAEMTCYEDPRRPLQAGTLLQVNERLIQIERNIGRGTSCLVYLALNNSKPCVVKELFPEGMARRGEIRRGQQGIESVEGEMKDAMRRFREACQLQRELSAHPNGSPWFVPMTECFFAGGTLYAVSPGRNGTSWDCFKHLPPLSILGIIQKVSDLTEALHHIGWLMVDIKDSNYLIDKDPLNAVIVRLADYDSLVPLDCMDENVVFRCSSVTASPELLEKRYRDVGRPSDVYGIAAMFLLKLANMDHRKICDDSWIRDIRAYVPEWPVSIFDKLIELFIKALSKDPCNRFQTCAELSEALKRISSELGSGRYI